MPRHTTPRDMPAQDPIDRLTSASERLRQVASDLYSADVEEVTAKTEVHVHNYPQPSSPDLGDADPDRVSALPSLPLSRPGKAGIGAGVLGLVSAAVALAKTLGWL